MPRPLVQKGAKWRQEYKEALKVSKWEKEEYSSGSAMSYRYVQLPRERLERGSAYGSS